MNRRNASLALSLLMFLPFSAGTKASSAHLQPPAKVAQDDQLLVGNWKSSQFGTQTLNTRPDGTATLTMRLSTMAAVLYGRELTLELKWTLEGQTLTQHVVGGTPEKGVQKLTRKFGDTYTYRVVEATPAQLVVEDASTGKTSHWSAL